MTKKRATAIHFLLSTVLAAFVVAVMTLVWYPDPLFEILGGHGLLLLIVGVDIVLGPALTFVIFKPNKKGLVFDLVAIGLFQIAALAYGLYTIAGVRPAYIVFVKDRFELVRAFDVKAENFAKAMTPAFRSAPWFGPEIIGVSFPTNEQEQFALINSALAGGPDIHLLPKYYVPFLESKPIIAKRAKSLKILAQLNSAQQLQIEALPIQLRYRPEDLGFVVFRAIRADIAMIVDARTGNPLKAVKLKPW